MKINGFILALLGAIVLAFLFPDALSKLPLKYIIDIGIGFIFFFYGLKLAPAEFKAGLLNYRSHILIQVTTFILFPLLTLVFIPFFEGGTRSDLWLSIFFLGVLPSTVSSSVVMVALAKGNLPTAIFNASISGIIGIIATPFLLSIFMLKTGEFEIQTVISKLLLQIMLPIISGLLLQVWLGRIARRYSKQLGLFDKGIIILIVYTSFSNSFNSGLFETVTFTDLLKIFGIVLTLFFVVYFSIGLACKKMGINLKDRITIQFCGTKKSLVHGSVMMKIIFGASASAGLFLLPIMLYHIFQLLMISVFAERYGNRIDG
ncbi:bile acid:sodium symporter [Gillisia sp. M10.2A]|uniref:Bile acid:sodium symporter n=1 Tax=Gillisia lutea TaxID=2909668 RepID=A0ABS9EHJ3_9FLAO|nr:bile acid:sodium symporter [Gillisia lutea]MCF4101782.1 bile acid:sodium symporter [Gillisia lutea]